MARFSVRFRLEQEPNCGKKGNERVLPEKKRLYCKENENHPQFCGGAQKGGHRQENSTGDQMAGRNSSANLGLWSYKMTW